MMPTYSPQTNGKCMMLFAMLLSITVLNLMPSVALAQILEKGTIKDLEEKFFLAVQNADTTTLSELLAKDYVETSGNPPITMTKADVLTTLSIAETRMIVDLKASSFDISNVSMHGKTALVHGQYSRISTDRNGKNTNAKGMFSHVWTKNRKKWQLISSHTSPLSIEEPIAKRESATEVLALMKKLQDAISTNDYVLTAEIMEDNYTEDFLFTSVSGTALPKASMISSYQPANWANLPITEILDVRDLKIRAHGDATIVTCQWDWKARKKDGSRADRVLRITQIYLKQDNEWKLAGMHSSSVVPQNGIMAKE